MALQLGFSCVAYYRLGLAKKMGMARRIEPYLTKVFHGNGYSMTQNGWMIWFMIIEPICREICLEFFATVAFEEFSLDLNYW